MVAKLSLPLFFGRPLVATRPGALEPPKFALAGIMPGMTLLEITYQLQEPLTHEQLAALGNFANTYGLRRFRVDESKNQLSFEYDASRLKETQVLHVLRHAKIPVTGKLTVAGTVDPIPSEPAALVVSR
jgi:hypothetical protein